ncbi:MULTISPECIES: DUF456 domain-containing protein [Bacillaceae]|uniref:DUF456 domain-containing protein n=1 Tax=Peribacillus huizhouensis TaxID=1501239 RepID=A0ABR6CKK3_9BACI|nr:MULTISPECIES: DUF456 domain-containing protein [Bacillaceae]MBA9025434.1 hypothetical protein [Peribacillus huizhouensis]
MDIVFWLIIAIVFMIGFIGLVYPIIPSVLFILGGILLYGIFYSFEPYNWGFWTIQILLVLLLFGADYVANLAGVKKFGGSKAGIWGSTIGILVGPFLIPFLGIIIGPFLGAVIAEMVVHQKNPVVAAKIGFGSVIGFVGSVVTKSIIQLFMVIYFLFTVL